MNEAPPPTITAVRLNGARHRAELPLLVLGPARGTAAAPLWSACAGHLGDAFDVLAWDLPGHGYNVAATDEPPSADELAAGVLAVVDDVLAERGELGGPFLYAGVGVGGEVGDRLRQQAPARVGDVVLLDDLDPARSPEEAARLVRRRLLGATEDDDGSGAVGRLAAALAEQVEAARAGGLSAAEVRAAWREVEPLLD